MAKVAVFIHEVWGTPDVWRNWRPFREAPGRHAIAPSLRHHDARPIAPPAGHGTTSLGNYVADVTKTTEGIPCNRGWWHKPHRDRRQATGLHATFVYHPGRALLEIGVPWHGGKLG